MNAIAEGTSPTLRLSISGMRCAGCVESVETALRGVPGVLEATVNFADHSAKVEGDVVIEAILKAKRGTGFDASTDTMVDMFEKGIVDAAKVTRSALQNAASVAAMVLTTEAVVSDIPEKKEPAAPGGHSHGGEMDF